MSHVPNDNPGICRDSAAGKMLAFHMANTGLIPRNPNGP